MKSGHCLKFGAAFVVTALLVLAASVAIGDQGERPKKPIAKATVSTENATITCSSDMKCHIDLAKREKGNRISVRLGNVTVETLRLRMKLEHRRILDAHIGDDGLIRLKVSAAH
jgi:hypothetical protein